MSAKNTLVFALVLIILLAMGAAAGSIVYSAIFLASLVNRVFVQQWIPYASYLLLVLVIIVTAYFTVRFIRQCRSSEMPNLQDSEILPLTIIIPALNEERTMVSCVDSIMAADYPKDKMELIIAHEVPPRCRDSTPQLVAQLAVKYPNVKVVPNDSGHKGSKAGAINNCLHDAKGTIIGIYDADHIIAKDALLRVTAEFSANPWLTCLGGKVIVRNVNYNWFTTIVGNECAVINNFSRYLSQLFTGRHLVYGSNLFIRKAALEDIGGFDETSLTEDCDLGMKLISQNYGMKVDYAIKSYEQPAVSIRDWWHQRVRWTWGGISVLKKYLKIYSADGTVTAKSIRAFIMYALSTAGLLFGVILMGFMGFMLYAGIVPPVILILCCTPFAILFAAESLVDYTEGRGSVIDMALSIFVRPWVIYMYTIVGVYAVVMDALNVQGKWFESTRI